MNNDEELARLLSYNLMDVYRGTKDSYKTMKDTKLPDWKIDRFVTKMVKRGALFLGRKSWELILSVSRRKVDFEELEEELGLQHRRRGSHGDEYEGRLGSNQVQVVVMPNNEIRISINTGSGEDSPRHRRPI